MTSQTEQPDEKYILLNEINRVTSESLVLALGLLRQCRNKGLTWSEESLRDWEGKVDELLTKHHAL